ncbi:TetR/AcrR family transcriptional regulator [Nocardia sp. NPDC051321]|uniref:TetR/AcrR family transcriptional regulator n=1 Tax=Nocardia sp. NPDC051321 TaxID=3364323 RepID=UPI0037B04AB2
MLDEAVLIVRAVGADGLSLPVLADAAGVSKPIVYDHFANRPRLLLALYERLYQAHRTASEQALADAEATAGGVARVMSEVYFACAVDMPEFDSVAAALQGNPDMEAIHLVMFDRYMDAMIAALRPYTDLTTAALALRCVGLLGAAGAIAAELNRGRTTREQAVTTLVDLMVSGLGARNDC